MSIPDEQFYESPQLNETAITVSSPPVNQLLYLVSLPGNLEGWEAPNGGDGAPLDTGGGGGEAPDRFGQKGRKRTKKKGGGEAPDP